jgi:hypothetical protein
MIVVSGVESGKLRSVFSDYIAVNCRFLCIGIYFLVHLQKVSLQSFFERIEIILDEWRLWALLFFV